MLACIVGCAGQADVTYRGDALLEGEVEANGTVDVTDDRLKRIAYTRLVRKGEGGKSVAHGPEVGYSCKTTLRNADGLCHGAFAGYTLHFESLSIGARLAGCHASFTNEVVDAGVNELGGELRALHGWDLPIVSVELGLGMGGWLLHQGFETRGLAPSRSTPTGSLALLLGLRADLANRFSVLAESVPIAMGRARDDTPACRFTTFLRWWASSSNSAWMSALLDWASTSSRGTFVLVSIELRRRTSEELSRRGYVRCTTAREAPMKDTRALTYGIGLGAGLMFLFDPRSGAVRRATIRQKATRTAHEVELAAGIGMRDLQHRAEGIAARLERIVSGRESNVSADLLVARVRSELGHVCSHPRAVDVSAKGRRAPRRAGPRTQGAARQVLDAHRPQARRGVHRGHGR